MTTTTAERMLCNYGSLSDIILHPNYNDFMEIDGFGPAKVESLKACF
jgi:DNA repair protein RadC